MTMHKVHNYRVGYLPAAMFYAPLYNNKIISFISAHEIDIFGDDT